MCKVWLFCWTYIIKSNTSPRGFSNLYLNMNFGGNTHCFYFLNSKKVYKEPERKMKKEKKFRTNFRFVLNEKKLDIWLIFIIFKVYFESIYNWYKTNFKQNKTEIKRKYKWKKKKTEIDRPTSQCCLSEIPKVQALYIKQVYATS